MPITFSEPSFNAGTTGCFHCNFLWTRAIRVDLNWGALYECDSCGKEYIMANSEEGWQPTVTIVRSKSNA